MHTHGSHFTLAQQLIVQFNGKILFYHKYLYNQIKQETVKHYWVKVFDAISPAVAEALAFRWVVSQALDIMEAITKPNENQA